MDWKKLLGSITASVDEELRLRNAYLVAENRLLRQQITGRVPLTDRDRKALAEMGQQLGKQALAELATVAKPDTILAWRRTCADRQCDHSHPPPSVGRPRIAKELEDLVVRIACENRSWGYDRIVGALTNLGYRISDQTVGNILKRHSIPPAPERKTTVTWREFIRMYMDMLGATDFFNSEMWSAFGLLLSVLLCFIYVGRQHLSIVGRSLHQLRHKVHARVLRALHGCAQGQRWVYGMTTCTRSGAMRRDTGPPCIVLPPCTPNAERQCLAPDLSIAGCLSAARSKQIRDGPRQRRQQRNIFVKEELRRAA
jgi:homeodomain-containing protein